MILKLILIFMLLIGSLIAKEKSLEHVSLQLKWKNQFQFAGYYIAKEKGYYKDLGLDVSILEYKNDIDIVDSVEKEKVQYGVGYPSVVLDKALGKKIILLSAIYQESPHVLLSLKSSGIKSIADFKDKVLMVHKSATKTVSLISMLRANHLNFNDMKMLAPSFDINSLTRKEADIVTAYISNEPYTLEKEGIAYDVWNPKDYGFDFYDDILFTSSEELKEHPRRVENFRKASLKGFEYAFSHIDETIALIQKKYNSQKKTTQALEYEATTLKKLAYSGVKNIGEINKVKIQRIIDIYNLFSLLKERTDVEDFIYKVPDAFCLTKAEQEYLQKKRVIKMCIDPNWMPFETLKDGKHIGMSADFFKLVNAKIDNRIEVVPTKTWMESLLLAQTRKCDILSLVMQTPERKVYLNFTAPYLNIPLVMATKQDTVFITDINLLIGKKIGIPQGYAFLEILKRKYPDLDIIEVENIDDGLTQVSEGKLYGYIGTLATIGYTLQKKFAGELKITAKFDAHWDLGIGVRNDDPMLFDILNKLVKSISESEKQKILNNWLSVKYEKSVDYHLLIEVIIVFIIILLIVVLFYIREKKLGIKIQAQKESMELSHTLLETLFDTIPNPIFYKDKNGVYQNCNSAFAHDIFQVPKDEIIGKKIENIQSSVAKEFLKLYTKKERTLYGTPGRQYYEGSIKIDNEGEKHYSFYKASLLSKANEILGLIGVMVDITELKNKAKELEELASIDSLSKLYNRRYFSNTAENIFSLAKREKQNLSMVMIDIDNFKNVNDTYGHKVGDDVIVILSETLLAFSRGSDIVCRFGGEEFILLLPKTDINGSAVIAEKIRKEVEKLSVITQDAEEVNFTISLGIAEASLDEQNLEATIKRTDDALYKAKESGKNKVCTTFKDIY